VSRSRRVLIILGVVVVGVLAWPYLPFADRDGGGADTAQSAELLRAQTGEIQRQTLVASEALTDVEGFSADLGRARAAVPVEPSLVELIDMLDAAATAAQLEWRAGTPTAVPLADFSGDDALPANAEVWQLTMSVSGVTTGVNRLLDSLRNLDRLVTVVSVSIQSADEGAGEVTGSLVLRYYTSAGDPAALEAEQAAVPTDATQGGTGE
jgi:ABC-type amino acid transport substrate-binding protein